MFSERHLDHGLIPAWAGKTYCSMAISALIRAHPRVGGENERSPYAVFGDAGSSPRGRGKLKAHMGDFAAKGLIPAWAGKTLSPRPRISAAQAHPRVGGENEAGDEKGSTFDGSSPRGRGKPAMPASSVTSSGLIPAWAGKT